jgi:peroxiredoxin
MRIIFALLSGLLMLYGCSESTSKGYEILAELEGELPDGTEVFLRRSNGDTQTIDVDTVLVEQGGFRFEGAIEKPELHYIFIQGLRGGIPLILENGDIRIRGHKDSLRRVRVGGTPQNAAYTEYLDGARSLAEQRLSMNEDMQAAMMQKDTAVMTALRDEFFELQDRLSDFEVTFIEEHPDALISALIVARMLQNKSRPVAEIKELYESLDPAVVDSQPGQQIAEQMESEMRTAIGTKAPEFKAPTPEGQELALSQALGKITLVDFWAAWCRPCRAENPNIVRVYNKYKDRGFKVLGVSLDRDADAWRQAIEQDGLDWQHVSNVRYFDEIAELYNVRAIPASFVLDENGVILAKDLRGPALEAKIAELLP